MGGVKKNFKAIKSKNRKNKLKNLIIKVPLEIQEQPKDKVEIDEGTTLKIQCKASGFPYPEYVWFVGDKEMSCCSDGVLKIKNIRWDFAFTNIIYIINIQSIPLLL